MLFVQAIRRLHSKTFWQRLEMFLNIVRPIIRVIRLADSNMGTLGKVCHLLAC